MTFLVVYIKNDTFLRAFLALFKKNWIFSVPIWIKNFNSFWTNLKISNFRNFCSLIEK